jgi:hypothetical protein
MKVDSQPKLRALQLPNETQRHQTAYEAFREFARFIGHHTFRITARETRMVDAGYIVLNYWSNDTDHSDEVHAEGVRADQFLWDTQKVIASMAADHKLPMGTQQLAKRLLRVYGNKD